MNAVSQFLSTIGLWPKPRLPVADADHIVQSLRDAANDANHLAGELNRIADQAEDPFGEFAYRARHSRFARKG